MSERGTVLVVDDDEDIRGAVLETLEDEGYLATGAKNGRDALEQLRAAPDGHPRLILLDMMMPVMDGRTFRAELLKDPLLALIPVVIMTADARVTDKATELRATGFLKKPIELEDLFSVARQFCGAPRT